MSDEDFMELMNRVAAEIIRRDEENETEPSDLADAMNGEGLKNELVCSMLYAAQEALEEREVDEDAEEEPEDDEP